MGNNFLNYEFSNRYHLLGKHIVKTVQRYHIPIDVIPLTQSEYDNEKSIRMEFIRNGISVGPHTQKGKST